MPKYSVIKIESQPGIQRDGTRYNAVNYTDGQWVRFWEGSPRKIGGYVYMLVGNNEIARDLYTVNQPSYVDLYIGRASTVSKISLNYNGIPLGTGSASSPNGNALTAEDDRTPTTGFSADPNNLWDFDLFTDIDNLVPGSSVSCIVAQVAPNADDISNTLPGAVFYGNIDDGLPLQPIYYENGTPIQVSGGLVSCPPILVAYGNDGNMIWSNPGQVQGWPILNFLNVANTKIVKAFRTRGQSPTIILWSLNSVIRATYTSVTTNGVTEDTFVSDTIEDSITVLSPDCIVQYDQMYFWIGTDQFYFYNGIVNKVPNTMNSNYFFEGINLVCRSKAWGMVIRKYSEIWFFYVKLTNADGSPNYGPSGTYNDAEVNAAVVLNTQTNLWYDTFINRASGYPATVFPFPIMASNKLYRLNSASGVYTTYPIWLHEQGGDELTYWSGSGNPTQYPPYPNNIRPVSGSTYNAFPILSYFSTHYMDLYTPDSSASVWMATRRIAPDFDYQGSTTVTYPMTVSISYRQYPNSVPAVDGPYTFIGETETVDTSSQGAIVSFTFTSNTLGGFYQMGKTLYYFEKGDTIK